MDSYVVTTDLITNGQRLKDSVVTVTDAGAEGTRWESQAAVAVVSEVLDEAVALIAVADTNAAATLTAVTTACGFVADANTSAEAIAILEEVGDIWSAVDIVNSTLGNAVSSLQAAVTSLQATLAATLAAQVKTDEAFRAIDIVNAIENP